MNKWLTSCVVITTLVGCSTTHEVQVQSIPEYAIPVEPAYPKIMASEVKCLSDETWEKIVTRDKLKSQVIKDAIELMKVRSDVSK